MELKQLLRTSISAIQDTSISDLDGAELALLEFCENRIAEIIEQLVVNHDECGAEARAVLRKFRL